MTIAGAQLGLDVLEDEVRGVDLAVRVRVADPDGLTLVLEDQHELDVAMRRELAHLLLPGREQRVDAVDVELGERHIVAGAVADHARDAGGGRVAIDAWRRRNRARGVGPDTRMIVVEHERARVFRVDAVR